MAYHISLSQDARPYPLLTFFGMLTLYCFMKYRETSKKIYLFGTALSTAFLFCTNYTSLPFILLFQLLWFYPVGQDKKIRLSSFAALNGLMFSFCMPWVLFILLHYKGLPITGPDWKDKAGSFWTIASGVVKDWVPLAPLAIASVALLILLPFLSNNRRKGLIFLALLVLPIGAISLFCELFGVLHFVSSRYLVTFLPIFLIAVYFSLDRLQIRFNALKRVVRLKPLFLFFLIASNLMILPLYYRSEKQDYRGLMNYLKGHLREGDKIIAGNPVYMGVMLHYLGIYPEGRQYAFPAWKSPEGELEHRVNLKFQDIPFMIIHSKSHWFSYLSEKNRLWLVADKENAKIIVQRLRCGFMGRFDGRAFNMVRFPSDASIYLFLCDPLSPQERGIDIPIE
jgi:hypothetical protein